MPRPTDLCVSEFRSKCNEFGFAYLGATLDRFIDIRFPKAGDYIEPVKDSRKRTLRQKTLDVLLAHRARRQDDKRAHDALTQLKLQVAEAVAPTALNLARSTLSGPAAIRQLAEDLRIASSMVGEGVTRRDMVLKGWSYEQLTEYEALARQTAYELEGAV